MKRKRKSSNHKSWKKLARLFSRIPKRAMLAAIIVGSLMLIGIGSWMVYKPFGPLVVGLLIWFDIFSWKRKGGNEK